MTTDFAQAQALEIVLVTIPCDATRIGANVPTLESPSDRKTPQTRVRSPSGSLPQQLTVDGLSTNSIEETESANRPLYPPTSRQSEVILDAAGESYRNVVALAPMDKGFRAWYVRLHRIRIRNITILTQLYS